MEALGYTCASVFLPLIRCQCFIRIFLRFGVAGLKVVTKRKISFDVLGLGLFRRGPEGSLVL